MAEYKLKYSGAEIDAKLDEIVDKQDTITSDTTLTLGSISAPNSSESSTYGTGTSGQVLKSNGNGGLYWANDNNTNRSISVNGSTINALAGTTTPVNFKAGDNVTITASGADITIAATGGSGGGVTIYTFIPPCTAVPIDSTTMIENIYFNTSLSEAEVISIIDNAFASVPDWPEELGLMTYVFMSETTDKWMMVMLGVQEGIYNIQAFNKEPTTEEEEVAATVFVSGPNLSEMEAPFTGWNPSFNGELAINETNAYVEMMTTEMGVLDQFKQLNEALKELISITPF